jgi:hypothetical protein
MRVAHVKAHRSKLMPGQLLDIAKLRSDFDWPISKKLEANSMAALSTGDILSALGLWWPQIIRMSVYQTVYLPFTTALFERQLT